MRSTGYSLLLTVAFALSSALFTALNEPFDVNNVLRLGVNVNGGFESQGSHYLVVTGDARGLPLVKNSTPPIAGRTYDTFCCRHWTHDGWRELSPPEAQNTEPILDTKVTLGDQPVAAVWSLENKTGVLISQPKQITENRLCITVLVRLPVNSSLTVKVQRADGSKSARIATIRASDSNQWILRRLEPSTPKALRRSSATLVMSFENQYSTVEHIYVQWAGFCEPLLQEQELLVGSKFDSHNVSQETRSVMLTPALRNIVEHEVCKNGGYLSKGSGLCHCLPGFSGSACELGCGPNKFGSTCSGECSNSKSERECSGFKICNYDSGCVCVAGWEGDTCGSKCPEGRYGSGCKRACGFCQAGSCNRHTGYCNYGCESGYQPPFCQDVCGRIATMDTPENDNGVVSPQRHPWNAGLYDITKGEDKPQHICSATLVRSRYAISAAHCVTHKVTSAVYEPQQYILAFGKLYRSWSVAEPNGNYVQRRKIRSIHVPPSYLGVLRAEADDIALLELVDAADINDFVRPACIDWSSGSQPQLSERSLGEVVGWGRADQNMPNEVLRVSRPAFIPLETCFKTVAKNFITYLGPDKFCGASIGGVALKQGDSGSGFTINSFLYGVVSVAPSGEYSITAFTNVSYHRDWLSNLWNKLDRAKALVDFENKSN